MSPWGVGSVSGSGSASFALPNLVPNSEIPLEGGALSPPNFGIWVQPNQFRLYSKPEATLLRKLALPQ